MSDPILCRCGQPADVLCQSRELGPKIEASRKGVKVTLQPYRTFHLCAECTRGELVSETPPRSAVPMPHHAARLRREKKEALDALAGHATQDRLGDWGRVT